MLIRCRMQNGAEQRSSGAHARPYFSTFYFVSQCSDNWSDKDNRCLFVAECKMELNSGLVGRMHDHPPPVWLGIYALYKHGDVKYLAPDLVTKLMNSEEEIRRKRIADGRRIGGVEKTRGQKIGRTWSLKGKVTNTSAHRWEDKEES